MESDSATSTPRHSELGCSSSENMLSAKKFTHDELVRNLLSKCLHLQDSETLNDSKDYIQDLIPYVPVIDALINTISIKVNSEPKLLVSITKTLDELEYEKGVMSEDWHNFIMLSLIDIFRDYDEVELLKDGQNSETYLLFPMVFDRLLTHIFQMATEGNLELISKQKTLGLFKKVYKSGMIDIFTKAKHAQRVCDFCFKNYPLMLPDLLQVIIADGLLRPLGIKRLLESPQCSTLGMTILLRYCDSVDILLRVCRYYFKELDPIDMKTIRDLFHMKSEDAENRKNTVRSSMTRPASLMGSYNFNNQPRNTNPNSPGPASPVNSPIINSPVNSPMASPMASPRLPNARNTMGSVGHTRKSHYVGPGYSENGVKPKITKKINANDLPKTSLTRLPFDKNEDLSQLDSILSVENLIILLKLINRYDTSASPEQKQEFLNFQVRILKILEGFKHKMSKADLVNVEAVDCMIAYKKSGPSIQLIHRIGQMLPELNESSMLVGFKLIMMKKLIFTFYHSFGKFLNPENRPKIADSVVEVSRVIENIFQKGVDSIEPGILRLCIVICYENALCLEEVHNLTTKAYGQLSTILTMVQIYEKMETPERLKHDIYRHIRHRILFDHRRYELMLDPYKNRTLRRDEAVFQLESAKKALGTSENPSAMQMKKAKECLVKSMQMLANTDNLDSVVSFENSLPQSAESLENPEKFKNHENQETHTENSSENSASNNSETSIANNNPKITDKYFEVWVALIQFARKANLWKITATACKFASKYQPSYKNTYENINSTKLAYIHITTAECQVKSELLLDSFDSLEKALEISDILQDSNLVATCAEYFWNFCVFKSKLQAVLEKGIYQKSEYLQIKYMIIIVLEHLYKAKLLIHPIFRKLVMVNTRFVNHLGVELEERYTIAEQISTERLKSAATVDEIDGKKKKTSGNKKVAPVVVTFEKMIKLLETENEDISEFSGDFQDNCDRTFHYGKEMLIHLDPNSPYASEDVEKMLHFTIDYSEDFSRLAKFLKHKNAVIPVEYTFLRSIFWLLSKENSELLFDDLKTVTEPEEVEFSTVQFLYRLSKVVNAESRVKFLEKAISVKLDHQQFMKLTNSEKITVALCCQNLGAIKSELKFFVTCCEIAESVKHESSHSIVLESAQRWYDQFKQTDIFDAGKRSAEFDSMQKIINSVNVSFKTYAQHFSESECNSEIPSNAELRVKLYLLAVMTEESLDGKSRLLQEGIACIPKSSFRLELFKQRAILNASSEFVVADGSSGVRHDCVIIYNSITSDIRKLKDAEHGEFDDSRVPNSEKDVKFFEAVFDVISVINDENTKHNMLSKILTGCSEIPENIKSLQKQLFYEKFSGSITKKQLNEITTEPTTESIVSTAVNALLTAERDVYKSQEFARKMVQLLYSNTLVIDEPNIETKPSKISVKKSVSSRASVRASKLTMPEPEYSAPGPEDLKSCEWRKFPETRKELKKLTIRENQLFLVVQAVLLLEPVEQAAGFQLVLLQAKQLRDSAVTASCCLRMAGICEMYDENDSLKEDIAKWNDNGSEYCRKVLAEDSLEIRKVLVLMRSALAGRKLDLVLGCASKVSKIQTNANYEFEVSLTIAVAMVLRLVNLKMESLETLRILSDLKIPEFSTIISSSSQNGSDLLFSGSGDLSSKNIFETLFNKFNSSLDSSPVIYCELFYMIIREQPNPTDILPTSTFQDIVKICSLTNNFKLLSELYYLFAEKSVNRNPKQAIILASKSLQIMSKHLELTNSLAETLSKKHSAEIQFLLVKAITCDLSLRVQDYVKEMGRQAAQNELERTTELYNENIGENENLEDDSWRDVDPLADLRTDVISDFQKVVALLDSLPEEYMDIANIYASKINRMSLKIKAAPVLNPAFAVNNDIFEFIDENEETHGQEARIRDSAKVRRATHAPVSLSRHYDIAFGGMKLQCV